MKFMRIVKLMLVSAVLSLAGCTTHQTSAQTHNETNMHSHAHNDAQHPPVDAISSGSKGGIRKISKEGCDRKTETQKHLDLVGKNVVVEMLWHDASPSVKKIRFPFQIIGSTNEGLIVLPHEFPMRELYIGILYNSGHLLFRDNKRILDPCSTVITEADSNNAKGV